MIDEDFEYTGDCCVCGDPVDFSDMGSCEHCGNVFHWGDCGTWFNLKHTCNDCEVRLENAD